MSRSQYYRRYYFYSLVAVISGGLLWSLNSVLIRYMVEPEEFRWQFLFYRGLSISFILILYQFTIFKGEVLKKFFDIGYTGLLGAVALALAAFCFIYSITVTSVAVTLFSISLTPVMTAIMARILLKEKIKKITMLTMTTTFIGCFIMAGGQYTNGSIAGVLLGLGAAFNFSLYTVFIRLKRNIPKPRTTIVGGLFTAILAMLMLTINGDSIFAIPQTNIIMSLLNGVLMGIGFVLFLFGARLLVAAELAILSLIEIIFGVFWSWVPFMGINETPIPTTVSGGGIILASIVFRTITLNKRKKYFKLKKKYLPPEE